MLIRQLRNLRRRVMLIRNMQAIGISSMLLMVMAMFALFAGAIVVGKYIFGASLVLLMIRWGFRFTRFREALNKSPAVISTEGENLLTV